MEYIYIYYRLVISLYSEGIIINITNNYEETKDSEDQAINYKSIFGSTND